MTATLTTTRRTATEVAGEPLMIAPGDHVTVGNGTIEYPVLSVDGDDAELHTRRGLKTVATHRLTIVWPEVTADDLPNVTLAFETRPCDRCNGTGQHGWSSAEGYRCYGCSGRGQVRTRAGDKAAARHDEVCKAMDIPAEDVKIGDRIRWTASTGYRTWRTVVGLTDAADGSRVTIRARAGEDGPTDTMVRCFGSARWDRLGGLVTVYSPEVQARAVDAALAGGGAHLIRK
jgi:hypothetical protein